VSDWRWPIAETYWIFPALNVWDKLCFEGEKVLAKVLYN
jgi:hypothetical protein